MRELCRSRPRCNCTSFGKRSLARTTLCSCVSVGSASRKPSDGLPPYVVAAVLVATGMWIVVGRDRPRSSPTLGLRPSQNTTSPALDIFPALSPDGTALAYASDRDGSFEIYVRQLTPGGDEVRLTSDGGQNLQPAWSPDGTRIVQSSKRLVPTKN